MKLIRSQDKLIVINAAYIHHIHISDEVDEYGDSTGKSEIDIYFDATEDGRIQTIATYRTEDECIRNLDRLAAFLSSNSGSGLHEMP